MSQNNLLSAILGKPIPPTDDKLTNFGNYAGSADTKMQALYLARKGLLGASDIYNSTPNTTSAEGIRTSQSDWKPAKVSSMLMTAKRLGITPQNIDANWDVVVGNDRYGQAIRNPNFGVIHKNFKDVFKSILADQYAKEKLIPNDIAKK